MPELQDSNAASSSGTAQEKPAAGENQQVRDGRTMEEVMAENKRKSDKIVALEKRNQELEKISQSRKLTSDEKEEKSDLESDIRRKARELRSDKELAPWVHLAKEESEQASTMAVTQAEIMRANDYLELRASERGIDAEELAEKIRPYIEVKQGESLWKRNFNALKKLDAFEGRVKSLDEREAKLKAQEEADMRFRETGSRIPRDKSIETKFDSAKTPQERVSAVVDLLDQYPGQKMTIK